MALNKAAYIAGLTADLTTIFEDLSGKTAAQKAAELATVLGDRVDTYVKTATVSTIVTGAAAPSGDVVTGTGSGSLA